jgi:hypothetical protein
MQARPGSADRSRVTVDFEKALAAGDVETISAGLQPLDEAERRRLASRATAWFRELKANTISRVTTGQWPYAVDSETLLRAARAMVLGTASLSELRKLGGWATPEDEIAFRIVADRRPDWLPEWAAFVVENQTTSWGTPFKLVRRLVSEGLVPRPATPWYPLSMIYGLQRRDRELSETLKGDPGLLDDEVWRLFEVEGGGETSLAAHDKYSGERRSWTWALQQLSDAGLLSRDRLLDASLDALRRDFAPFRAGWFSRFHEAMRPNREERASRADRYLALLHSPVPATVSFAVKALGEAGPLPADAVEQLSAALASPASSVVKAALKLLAPTTRSAELAAGFLGHRSVDIQTALLGFIEKCPSDSSVRERLERARSGLAPSLSARVAKLLDTQPPKMAASIVASAQLIVKRRTIDLAVPAPVENIADLVELLASLLERIDDPHDIERALDGVLRFCERTSDAASRLGPITKRATRLLDGRVPVPFSGFSTRSDIAGLIIAWATGVVPLITHHHRSILGFLSGRVHEVATRAASGHPGELLSLPTGHGGTLRPDELDARRRRAREMGWQSDQLDQLQADLRAYGAPEPARQYRFVYGTSGEKHVSFQLHTEPRIKTEPAPTDVPALFYAAVEGGGNQWATPFDYCADMATGVTEQIRWIGTVWPSNREPYYARGALALGGNIDWWQALWDTKQFLEPLLMPTEPLGEMGTLLLSLGLGAKEAGERGLATDVAIAAVADRRLDVRRAGKTIAELYNGRILKGSRLASSLGDASRISSEHAASVSELIEVVLSGLYRPPADLHALLSLLNELQASLGHGIWHPSARAYLVGIEGTGKTADLARQLLARS